MLGSDLNRHGFFRAISSKAGNFDVAFARAHPRIALAFEAQRHYKVLMEMPLCGFISRQILLEGQIEPPREVVSKIVLIARYVDTVVNT